MKLKKTVIALALGLASAGAFAQVVGVSWSNFQEERWKTDEKAIKDQLAKLGASYISADAGGSPEKQLSDVDSLIAKGAKVLIVLAMDKDAILPAVNKANQQKIPVVAYDRLIEAPGVFYITFDNVEVGRMQARAVLEAKPKGNYVMIKGSPTDPNANFLRAGQQEAIDAAVNLANKKPVAGSTKWADGEKKVSLDSKFLKPVAITRDNLDVVIKAGWITKDAACKGVDAATAPAACK